LKKFRLCLDSLGSIVLTQFTELAMISKSESKGHLPGVGAKIPHEVYAALIKLKEATGKTESQLINEAIALYVGVDLPASVPDRLSQVEATLKEVQATVASILKRFEGLPGVTPTPTPIKSPKAEDNNRPSENKHVIAHPEGGVPDSTARNWAKGQGWSKDCGKSFPEFMQGRGWRKVGGSNQARWFED